MTFSTDGSLINDVLEGERDVDRTRKIPPLTTEEDGSFGRSVTQPLYQKVDPQNY